MPFPRPPRWTRHHKPRQDKTRHQTRVYLHDPAQDDLDLLLASSLALERAIVSPCGRHRCHGHAAVTLWSVICIFGRLGPGRERVGVGRSIPRAEHSQHITGRCSILLCQHVTRCCLHRKAELDTPATKTLTPAAVLLLASCKITGASCGENKNGRGEKKMAWDNAASYCETPRTHTYLTDVRARGGVDGYCFPAHQPVNLREDALEGRVHTAGVQRRSLHNSR